MPVAFPAVRGSPATVRSVSRSCARPGCRRPAVATLSYAYASQAVWIDDLDPSAHPMTHDLCQQHAENTRVPRGWELRDRRIPAAGHETTAAVVGLRPRLSA